MEGPGRGSGSGVVVGSCLRQDYPDSNAEVGSHINACSYGYLGSHMDPGANMDSGADGYTDTTAR